MQPDPINRTRKWVRKLTLGEASGHDWSHIERVFNVAEKVATEEGGDLFVVRMAALLHDVDDPKLAPEGSERALEWMCELGIETETIAAILDVISQVSFSKNKDKTATTKEAAIVRDADRLDAIGAIGIARCFAYGGASGRPIYNPSDLVSVESSNSKRKTENPLPRSGIAHFYDKLLLVSDQMLTESGKRIAAERHEFLETFLDRFFAEWGGEK